MTAHFLYLIATSLRNAGRTSARRMRSPRYAIAAIVGLLYFFFIFGGWLPADEAGEEIGRVGLDFGRRIGPLVLALLSARWWLWHSRFNGIRLSPAETHVLLPAPVSRTHIVRYKILQVQPAIAMSALIATFFTRGTPLPWPLRLVSVWLLLATLHQHQIAASLVHASAQQHGRTGVRANLLPLIIFLAGFTVLVHALLGAAADIRAQSSLAFASERLLALLDEPGPRIVLTPFRLLLAPVTEPAAAEWPAAFLPALLVMAVHYLWVVRTDVAFEEAAIERGAYMARLVEAGRTGGMSRVQLLLRGSSRISQPWLPLPPLGNRSYAIFWKNVLYIQRGIRLTMLRLALFMLLLTLSIGMGSGARDFAQLAALLLLIGAALLTFFGPLAFRNDLRTDLAYMAVLRTLPLRGRSLVAAAVSASALVITLFQLALLWSGLVVLSLNRDIPASDAALFALAGTMALPIVNLLGVLIQNALALLYPSWVRIGEDGGGVEMMGQAAIVFIGSFIMLALLALPPLLAGAIVGGPLIMLLGPLGIVPGAAAALAVAAGEAVLLTLWLGRLYDRTDPVAAGLLR